MDVSANWQAPAILRENASMERDSEERQLLASIRAGDRAAAEEIAERSYRGVFASLVRLCGGNSDLAGDLTQETFRKAWEALSSFDGRSKISTWLYRIAYTTFLNHIRRPNLVAAVDPELPDPEPSAEVSLVQSQRAERLRAAVLQLPDDLRFVVTARFWGELPVADIAELERVTTVAIRKRLNRAFALLEEQLQGDLS